MVDGAREALGDRLVGSFAVAPDGRAVRRGPHRVELGDHPIPWTRSRAAAERALAWAAQARAAGEPVIGLVSGGASALCEAPRPPLDMRDLAALHRKLVGSGAPADEMNAVRRTLSAIKDGRLGAALGATLAAHLVLADVPSGRAEVVASGPLAAPVGDPAEALAILDRHRIDGLGAVRSFLEREIRASSPLDYTPPTAELLATPASLAEAMAEALGAAGVGPVHTRPATTVPVHTVAAELVDHLRHGDGALVVPGEVAIRVPDLVLGGWPLDDTGGRARHLAASVLARMARTAPAARWSLLAVASDGRDAAGAAGVLVDQDVDASGVEEALDLFASGRFFAARGVVLPETPPVTNLTDLYVAVRTP